MRKAHEVKINLVLPHQLPFPPEKGGGVENLNWLLAKEFSRLGHAVTAYSRSFPHLAKEETDAHGIQHVRVRGYDRRPNRWVDHAFGLAYMTNIRKVIRRADLTSSHTPFSFLLPFGKENKGVYTHTIHRTPKWYVPFYSRLPRVYCGSDAVVKQALAIYPRMKNLKRVYNCVDIDADFLAPQRAKAAGLHFLYVGRFVRDKGLESLIRGFRSALRDYPLARLTTVGPQQENEGGDQRFFAGMSGLVERSGMQSSIRFLPPIYQRERLEELISSADVICVPSLGGETFSMAVLEAMALSKPVLVSDFGPMVEAVDHKVSGYIASAGDADSLAQGIRYFSAEPGLAERMGRAALAKAAECFSVEKIAAEYLSDFGALSGAGVYVSKSEPQPQI